MVTVVELVLAMIVVYAIYYFFSSKKKYNLPPGPWNIPFVSGIFTVGATPHVTFQQWAKKYGPLIRTKFGLADALIIDDPKLIREAFHHPAFNGRMDFKALTIFSNGKHGIVNAEGQEWAEQRRFVLRSLREFGFGKQSMETFILEELSEFLKWMKAREGVPTEMRERFVLATVNSIWTMIAGQRQDHDDAFLKHIMKQAHEIFSETGKATGLLVFFPKLIEILPKFLLKDWFLLIERVKPFMKIFEDAIDSHIENPVDETEPRDLIDVYLTEIKKTTDPNSSFYGKRGYQTLQYVMSDLYGAGQGTTSSLLAWSILYLVRFPDVQKKFQKELDSVIGRNRQPRLADRPNLPYTEAMTMEIHRFSTLTPLGLFHETTEDTTLGGYDIRKGTVVIPNFYSNNYSKEIYGDPEVFRPERFLSPDGQKVIKREELIPFGTGKRQCLGETLGRDNYFLFITTIFQKYDIVHDPSQPPPDLEGVPGFFREPTNFSVIFNERIM